MRQFHYTAQRVQYGEGFIKDISFLTHVFRMVGIFKEYSRYTEQFKVVHNYFQE
jgi:hypothetical protein